MRCKHIKDISINSINKDVFEDKGIVILHFFAKWCKPCEELSKILESVAEENDIRIYKVNFDRFRQVSRNFEVISLPTLIFFKNGKEKYRVSGSQNKKQIEIILSII